MELKQHARSYSEKRKSISVLIVCYIVLAIISFIYSIFLSISNFVSINKNHDVIIEMVNLPPVKNEQEEFVPPPLPEQEKTETQNIVKEIAQEINNLNDINKIIEENKSVAVTDTTIENDTLPKDNLLMEKSGTSQNNTNESYNSLSGNEDDINEGEIYIIADKMPMFAGGDSTLREYIQFNIVYPEIARKKGIEGTVYMKFCVTTTGNVAKATVTRGVNPFLDQEAIRVISNLPKFTPGEHGGKTVNVWYSVPVKFQL